MASKKVLPFFPYVKQIGYERGQQEGEARGALALLTRGLCRKFKAQGEAFATQRSGITDLEKLVAIQDRLLEAKSLAGLQCFLPRPVAKG